MTDTTVPPNGRSRSTSVVSRGASVGSGKPSSPPKTSVVTRSTNRCAMRSTSARSCSASSSSARRGHAGPQTSSAPAEAAGGWERGKPWPSRSSSPSATAPSISSSVAGPQARQLVGGEAVGLLVQNGSASAAPSRADRPTRGPAPTSTSSRMLASVGSFEELTDQSEAGEVRLAVHSPRPSRRGGGRRPRSCTSGRCGPSCPPPGEVVDAVLGHGQVVRAHRRPGGLSSRRHRSSEGRLEATTSPASPWLRGSPGRAPGCVARLAGSRRRLDLA